MANSSAKKLYKANSKKLSSIRLFLLITNLVYALRFVIVRSMPRFYQVVWLILLVLYTLPYVFLRSAAQPTFDSYGNIVDAGTDLSNPGVLEYCHDLIYLTAFVHVGLLLTKWILLAYFIVPAFAAYKMCSGNPLSSGGNEEQDEQFEEYALMSRKDRRKADRKAKRQR